MVSLRKAQYLKSEVDPSLLEEAKAEVAFVGRSNVGKSSFLNALCQQPDMAKTSKTPGRTRAINVFAVEHLRWMVDLPGYGFAVGSPMEREKWSAMIEGYLTQRESLKGIFLLIDTLVGPTRLDHQMMDWLANHQKPYFLVGSKIDKVPKSQLARRQAEVARALDAGVTDIAWISSKEGLGLPAVRQLVIDLLK